MTDAEFLLVLLLAAAVLVRVAEATHVPYPIVLVLGGLGIAFVPGLPDVALDPELVFLLFLPPLVHSAGWNAAPEELRAVLRPLSLVAVGLVFATAAAITVVAHAVVPGLSWEAAFVLGTVLSPTDVVAPIAIFRRLGVPERVRVLVESESMVNDASALVLFAIAVDAATGEGFSVAGGLFEFVAVSVGGAAVGLAVGWLSAAVIRRQTDSGLVILLTVLTAYGAYIGAEAVHVSGILAAVVAGLYTGSQSPHTMDADTRLTAIGFWQVLVFGLEVTLFVLLGLQLPTIVDSLRESGTQVGEMLLPALAVAAALILVRIAWVFMLRSDAGDTPGQRFTVAWSGVRGAVSLAAALAVPLSVAERPEIVFIAFAVILLTLVGQGLTLPALIRALHVEEPRRWSDEEAAARMEAAQAALDRIDTLEEEGMRDTDLRRLRELYRTRFRICAAVLDGGERPLADHEQRIATYGDLRKELIGVERDTLNELRAGGRLRQATMRQIQRDLDLEEARLRT